MRCDRRSEWKTSSLTRSLSLFFQNRFVCWKTILPFVDFLRFMRACVLVCVRVIFYHFSKHPSEVIKVFHRDTIEVVVVFVLFRWLLLLLLLLQKFSFFRDRVCSRFFSSSPCFLCLRRWCYFPFLLGRFGCCCDCCCLFFALHLSERKVNFTHSSLFLRTHKNKYTETDTATLIHTHNHTTKREKKWSKNTRTQFLIFVTIVVRFVVVAKKKNWLVFRSDVYTKTHMRWFVYASNTVRARACVCV